VPIMSRRSRAPQSMPAQRVYRPPLISAAEPIVFFFHAARLPMSPDAEPPDDEVSIRGVVRRRGKSGAGAGGVVARLSVNARRVQRVTRIRQVCA